MLLQKGKIPIHIAAENGHKEILQYLFNNSPLDCFMVPAADKVHTQTFITVYHLPYSTIMHNETTLASVFVLMNLSQYNETNVGPLISRGIKFYKFVL